MSANAKKANPVTENTLKTINNLKVNSPPLFTEIVRAANKYQQQCQALSQAGIVLADTIARLTVHNTGDFGEGLKKLSDVIRELETKRDEVSKTLLNDFIAPCKQSIETDHKDILTFEKNYKKDKENMRQEILKLEAKTRKAGKKTTAEVLKQQITELNDKIKESDQLNTNKLRDVVLMERRKFATFLSQFNQFLDKELDLSNESNVKLTAGLQTWRDLINVQNQLPGDVESLISKQERTLVQIQPQADNGDSYRISYAPGKVQGGGSSSAAGYDTYESYDSYDNYDSSYENSSYTDNSYDYNNSGGGGELQARALYDYESQESTDLNLRAGDIITVIQQDDGSGWTKGRDYHGTEGIFPSSYIEYISKFLIDEIINKRAPYLDYEYTNYTGQRFEMHVPGRYHNVAADQKSMKIGPNTKIRVWEPNGKIWEKGTGNYPEGSTIPYDSITQAVDNSFKFSIDIRFKHTIAGKPENDYTLAIKPLHFENSVITSGGDYLGVQIPQLNPPDSLIVSQISVREVPWPHQIVANGSVYFKYNPTTEDITFTKTEGFPVNMDIEKDDIWGFTITLKEIWYFINDIVVFQRPIYYLF
ncbi:SH3 domain-containing protein [Heterostelium album PN500]|uniref:SH3 domain-containing protein n=1 Tax=Heterostelium pallidum (strain ATCC 26659 / Pp 5 / PN500) TaxID=670386 RepID=D3B2V1_HETP5|nr:SH3 domain-containing protein [Heterostelium album PN500]EFA83649.1 SH3 domain-containing protein [Heterostelium album PN500]|eukprot:XP_020435766.1 SH3 domain-containing protein [Heterostelium album PN500]